ncbi:MAG: hypothetical protein K2L25_03780 [Alphaproteobacteria bacterium]|nr:hypothetical protein [Alphaproteobacteria bacterium]
MKKTITLLCGAVVGIILANDAGARTCGGAYTVMCPIMEGETNCCRSSSETCAQAGCSSLIIDPIDPIEPATCPTECPGTLWTSVSGQNYQVRCKTTAIKASCEYQCKKGYYGSGQSCTRCPSSGGVYGTTALAGATAITACYLPSGTTFSDTTGSGTYTDACYYQN